MGLNFLAHPVYCIHIHIGYSSW